MRAFLPLSLLVSAVLGAVEEVTSQGQFQKILAEYPAVSVDFYSQTCGPCIMMAPIFKDLASEYEGRVKFIKVDVQRYHVGVQIRSMPTFHFYVQARSARARPIAVHPPPLPRTARPAQRRRSTR